MYETNLRDFVADPHSKNANTQRQIMIDLTSAIGHLHIIGYAHMHIMADNVFVVANDASVSIKLATLDMAVPTRPSPLGTMPPPFLAYRQETYAH